MKSASEFKVLWAVDVTAKKKQQFATFKTLAKLTQKSKAAIEPVCILTPDQLRVPKSAFKGESKHYALEAETVLNAWVKELKNPQLVPPRLLMQDVYSTNSALDVLLKHARESGAELIAVGTHNKTGFERLFVGSFAETLMLKSDIPLLIVNPKSVAAKITRILFPTDFSENSAEAFGKLLSVAKVLGAKVTLYYKMDYIVPETEAMMRIAPDYTRYLKLDKEAKERSAEEWKAQAKQAGVKLDFLLDDKAGFVPEGIIKAAKKTKASMIAMASHSGAFSATVLGSVARQVVRMAVIPMWVIHPAKKQGQAQKESAQATGSQRGLTGAR